jgi:hypothetical protein
MVELTDTAIARSASFRARFLARLAVLRTRPEGVRWPWRTS